MEVINQNQNQNPFQLNKHLRGAASLLVYALFAWAGSYVFPVVLVEVWRIPDPTGAILFNVFVVSQLFYVFRDVDPLDVAIMMLAGGVVYLLFCGAVVYLVLLVPAVADYERGAYTAVILFAVAFVASDIGGDVARVIRRI